jgi:hypothetical protein
VRFNAAVHDRKVHSRVGRGGGCDDVFDGVQPVADLVTGNKAVGLARRMPQARWMPCSACCMLRVLQ